MAQNRTVSNVCYHFTGWTKKDNNASFEKLKLILNFKAFKMARNKRQWNINKGYRKDTALSLSHYYPKMVCFTETPISFLKDFIAQKGGYCIGMKKDWLLRKGGQNVIYVDNDHPNDYGRALTELLCRFRAPEIDDMDSQKSAQTHSSIKEALLAATEDIGFHEEREWRIIRNDLNEFMIDDDVTFDISDIESIWCLEEYLPKLKESLNAHPESGHLIPLIRSSSTLN